MALLKIWGVGRAIMRLLVIQFVCWLGWFSTFALAQFEISEGVTGSVTFPALGVTCVANLAVLVTSLIRGRLDLEMGARDVLDSFCNPKLQNIEGIKHGSGLTTCIQEDSAIGGGGDPQTEEVTLRWRRWPVKKFLGGGGDPQTASTEENDVQTASTRGPETASTEGNFIGTASTEGGGQEEEEEDVVIPISSPEGSDEEEEEVIPISSPESSDEEEEEEVVIPISSPEGSDEEEEEGGGQVGSESESESESKSTEGNFIGTASTEGGGQEEEEVVVIPISSPEGSDEEEEGGGGQVGSESESESESTRERVLNNADVIMLSNCIGNWSMRQFIQSNAPLVHSIVLEFIPLKRAINNEKVRKELPPGVTIKSCKCRSRHRRSKCDCIVFWTMKDTTDMLNSRMPGTLKRFSDSLCLLPCSTCLTKGCHECNPKNLLPAEGEASQPLRESVVSGILHDIHAGSIAAGPPYLHMHPNE